MGDLLRGYLPLLLLTWGIEVPLLVVLLRGIAGWRRCLVGGLVASGVTHPLLCLVWPRVVPLDRYAPYLASGEVLVFLAETAILWALLFGARRSGLRIAALASLACNAASCGVGLLLGELLGR